VDVHRLGRGEGVAIMKRLYVYSSAWLGWTAGVFSHDIRGLYHWILIAILTGITVALGWRLETNSLNGKR